MPEVHIDLDEPEAAPAPPSPRRRRRAIVAVAAAVAAIAAGTIVVRLTAPPEPAGPLSRPQAWSVEIPAELGESVTARVKGEVVLIAAERGLLAVERATGEELWRRDLTEVIARVEAGQGLGTSSVDWYLNLAGNSLMMPVYDGGDVWNPSAFEVVDLPTGATRFTFDVDEDSGEGSFGFVTPGSLIVVRPGDPDELTAVALSDGRELWRHSTDQVITTPRGYSVRAQAISMRNSAATGDEPPEDAFILLSAEPDAGVPTEANYLDLADGETGPDWRAEDPNSHYFEPVQGLLIDVAEPRVMRAYDPVTGTKLWESATLRDFSMPGPVDSYTFTDGLLIDADLAVPADQVTYQLIDLSDGTVSPGADLGGRRLVAVDADYAVGLDPDPATLTAITPGGATLWTTSLRPKGWTTPGFQAEGFLTGDGWLAVEGRVGVGGDSSSHLWFVDLATGEHGSVPDGRLLGFEGGALVSTGASGTAVALTELGAR
ncbi:hypothetical protein AB0I28_22635 [Phytomonospora sp. NPDC050363]|uniref:hypothetical protein n=1 Tax=Phytomonospora sp. NPDC050363 TaxID=3155642 RepID=UPI0033FA8FCB